MKNLMLVYAIILVALLGCKSGSDEFSQVLEDPSGGQGTASIAITSYYPGTASFTVKSDASTQFLVSAVGNGTLTYTWTLNDATVGINSPNFNLNSASYSVGNYILKVTINDSVGSASQEWSVKINGTPVVASSVPAGSSAQLRRQSTLNYSVAVTDPNIDTVTYVWKLDGQEGVLTSVLNNANWTPALTDVGTHVVSVDIYDGPASDSGTYRVTHSWTTYVNSFHDSCNEMENQSQTNKTCVFSGVSGIGDGLDPETAASSFYIRPAGIFTTAESNLFISDDLHNVVWYYNKYTAPSVTIFGVTIPINKMKVVAGTGVYGQNALTSSMSSFALRNSLNGPTGMFYDGTDLYLTESAANRVIKINASGLISVVSSNNCTAPKGIVKIGTNLYVACNGSNSVRKIDLLLAQPSTSTLFGGTGSNGDPVSNAQSARTTGDGILNGPWALATRNGNLYVGEEDGCRIRAYNLDPTNSITFFGTQTISAGNQAVIAGKVGSPANNCPPITGPPLGSGRLGFVHDMTFDSDGTLYIGVDKLNGQNNDMIMALNFSSSPVTKYGVTIGAYELKRAYGAGNYGYTGEGQSLAITRFNGTYSLSMDYVSGDLYVGDYQNRRLRKIRFTQQTTALVAGNGNQRIQTSAGQGLVEVASEKMYLIRGMAVDQVTGEVFVVDSSNFRIRTINRYGQSDQAAGIGTTGTGAEEDVYPTSATMNLPRGVTLTHKTSTFGGHLVWGDSNNHRVRIWNRSNTAQTLFGVSVGAGMVASLGGDGNTGNLTSGSPVGVAAFDTPSGVAFDGTNLYIADTANHCVKKLDPSGNLSVVTGICGAGNGGETPDGPTGTAKVRNPEGLAYYENGDQKGLVIASRNGTSSRLKFHRLVAGSTDILFNTVIPAGWTTTFACSGTYNTEGINANIAPCDDVYSIAVVGTKVCFVNFKMHNVRCIKDTGEINTVLGGLQGVTTSFLYAPGGSFSDETYSAATPNYTTQNGVVATNSSMTEPAQSTSYGQISFPMSIQALDSNTILVGEYYTGLIRKVKLP